MSKFWQKKYISEYTGAEIDAAVAKAGELTKVTANPTLAGTEAALTGLEVGDTKYKVEQPINVEANPTLAGTEAALTGLQVGSTKYKVNGTPGYYTITATELASIAIAVGTAVAAATDKLQVYSFDIPNTDPGYESINATIENICAHPGFNYISVMGSDNMLVYTTDDHTIKTGPVSYSGADLHFWLRGTVNDKITIEMTTQKLNVAN